MNKEEKNVYTNLFEYPTKIIVRLENENEKLQQENEKLQQENKKLKENWNKLKVMCMENLYFYSGIQNEDLEIDTSMQDVLNKMQELEGENNE